MTWSLSSFWIIHLDILQYPGCCWLLTPTGGATLAKNYLFPLDFVFKQYLTERDKLNLTAGCYVLMNDIGESTAILSHLASSNPRTAMEISRRKVFLRILIDVISIACCKWLFICMFVHYLEQKKKTTNNIDM